MALRLALRAVRGPGGRYTHPPSLRSRFLDQRPPHRCCLVLVLVLVLLVLSLLLLLQQNCCCCCCCFLRRYLLRLPTDPSCRRQHQQSFAKTRTAPRPAARSCSWGLSRCPLPPSATQAAAASNSRRARRRAQRRDLRRGPALGRDARIKPERPSSALEARAM